MVLNEYFNIFGFIISERHRRFIIHVFSFILINCILINKVENINKKICKKSIKSIPINLDK